MWSLLPGRGLLLLDDVWVSDLLDNNLPPRVFLGRHLRAGTFPLWVPGAYTGLPLLPQGEAAAANPLTWLLFGLLDAATAINVSVALHLLVAGLGTVLLARRLGASPSGAVVGGLAYMLCGFSVGHVKHLNLHHAAAWVPVVLWAADRVLESPGWRRALLLGAIGGLMLTEGHPQIVYVSLLLGLPLLALRGARLVTPTRSLRAWGTRLFALAGSLLVAAQLAAAYLVAALELAGRSVRLTAGTDRWAFATHFGFEPETLATLFWARAFGDVADGTWDASRGIFWESWLYVGLVPAGAAVVGLVAAVARALRSRRISAAGLPLLLASLSALAFALMCGARSAVYRLAFDWVPGLDWFRFHHRYALVLELSVALLAALGVTKVLSRARGHPHVHACLSSVLVLATAADLISVMAPHFPSADPQAVRQPPTSVRWLRDHAPDQPWRLLSIGAPEAHVAAFERARGWSGDLQPYLDQRALLQPAAHLLWDLEAVNGYTSMVPRRLGAVFSGHGIGGSVVSPSLFRTQRGRLDCSGVLARALGAFNARYLLAPVPLGRCEGLTAVAALSSGAFTVHVFDNARALPRAWLVDHVTEVSTDGAAAQLLVSAGFDPRVQVLRTTEPVAHRPGRVPRLLSAVKRSPSGPAAPPGACSHETLAPGHSKVTCEASRPAWLVVSETRDPGQHVTLDGERVEVFTANAAVIGLRLPAGRHVVEVAYRPAWAWLVPAGAAGWLLLLGVACVDGLRRLSARRRRTRG